VIRESGVRYHEAYDAGMPRLSCVFCVLAGERELVLAARLNPTLADTYADVEERIGHTFQNGRSMADIKALAADPTYSTERLEPAVSCDATLF
jgi:3'-phosphoadenosine 5'-phosphosulfate sulfotransferase (PAPS reductase)/FAD synthetase